MGAIERTCFRVRPRLRALGFAPLPPKTKRHSLSDGSKKTTPSRYPVCRAVPQAVHRSGRVMEYVSLEGLRLDGRRPKETRRMRCELTALPGSDGSAVFELGNTKVLAAVHGPHECRRPSERLEDRLLVKCEVSMAAFSTGERRRRTKGDRRTNELSTFVRRCIETCVSAELLARSQLDVSIQVLQADGGVRAAAVNAAVLAIVDAGIPMQDTMACCSAGYLDDTPLLDLNYMEVRNPSSPQMPRQIPSVRLFFFSHRRSGRREVLRLTSVFPIRTDRAHAGGRRRAGGARGVHAADGQGRGDRHGEQGDGGCL